MGSGDRGGAASDSDADGGREPVRAGRRRQRFEYVVTEFVEGTRIAPRGESDDALSDDVISVTSHEGGTRVAYEADLRLTGVYRVAEPFLRSTFERMGDAALDGLAARLSRAG